MHDAYRISPDCIWKEADGRIYILQPDREEIHALNETATFIWKLLDKGYAPEDIVRELSSQFDVSEKQARTDVREFLARYVRENMLMPVQRRTR